MIMELNKYNWNKLLYQTAKTILVSLGISILLGLLIGFIMFIEGLPGQEVDVFQNRTVACIKWNDKWSYGMYPHRQCYKLTPIK